MQTVLVIDDTALDREAIARLLEYEGFQTIRAGNGKEGWATLYDHTPDLVLLDLMMPEMDGITFLRMVRRSDRWQDLPVIVLTGLSSDNILTKKALELGVNEIIPKASFGVDELLSRIKQHAGAAAAPRPA